MKKTLLLLAVLSLAACEKTRSETSEPTLTGGSVRSEPVAIDEIRLVMLEQRPSAASTINALQIVNDNGVVTLRGRVDDEPMRKALIERVKRMPGVKDVKDDLVVPPPSMMDQPLQR